MAVGFQTFKLLLELLFTEQGFIARLHAASLSALASKNWSRSLWTCNGMQVLQGELYRILVGGPSQCINFTSGYYCGGLCRQVYCWPTWIV